MFIVSAIFLYDLFDRSSIIYGSMEYMEKLKNIIKNDNLKSEKFLIVMYRNK